MALLAPPERLVHIGDRESDIYELSSIAQDAGTHSLLRPVSTGSRARVTTP